MTRFLLISVLSQTIFEDTKWGFKKTEKFRTLFLIQTLTCLKDELKKKNITLIVDIKSATIGIPKFIDLLKITDLFYQNEWTKEENDISDSVKKAISKKLKYILIMISFYITQKTFHLNWMHYLKYSQFLEKVVKKTH